MENYTVSAVAIKNKEVYIQQSTMDKGVLSSDAPKKYKFDSAESLLNILWRHHSDESPTFFGFTFIHEPLNGISFVPYGNSKKAMARNIIEHDRSALGQINHCGRIRQLQKDDSINVEMIDDFGEHEAVVYAIAELSENIDIVKQFHSKSNADVKAILAWPYPVLTAVHETRNALMITHVDVNDKQHMMVAYDGRELPCGYNVVRSTNEKRLEQEIRSFENIAINNGSHNDLILSDIATYSIVNFSKAKITPQCKNGNVIEKEFVHEYIDGTDEKMDVMAQLGLHGVRNYIVDKIHVENSRVKNK